MVNHVEDIHVLLVEDNAAHAELIRRSFEDQGWPMRLTIVGSLEEARSSLKKETPELAIIDVNLPDGKGVELLAGDPEKSKYPTIILTSIGEAQTAVDALKAGAIDYVVKEPSLADIPYVADRALREWGHIIKRKRAEMELLKSREQLRNLSNRLQSVHEAEKIRIARHIHDDMGQALTALKLDLAWMERKMGPQEEAVKNKFRSLYRQIDEAASRVQAISSELRPTVLNILGIGEAIKWQAKKYQDRTGVSCDVELNPAKIELDSDRSTMLFRVYQEILTNVARHSGADKVFTHMDKQQDQLILNVRDNGKGIDKEKIFDMESLGLLGIRERVLVWDGNVKFEGQPGKGTTVSINIPLGNHDD